MGWFNNTSLNVSDYPEPKFKKEPQCPICGDVCQKYYKMHNVIIGCDQCVTWVYADEDDTEG